MKDLILHHDLDNLLKYVSFLCKHNIAPYFSLVLYCEKFAVEGDEH